LLAQDHCSVPNCLMSIRGEDSPAYIGEINGQDYVISNHNLSHFNGISLKWEFAPDPFDQSCEGHRSAGNTFSIDFTGFSVELIPIVNN